MGNRRKIITGIVNNFLKIIHQKFSGFKQIDYIYI